MVSVKCGAIYTTEKMGIKIIRCVLCTMYISHHVNRLNKLCVIPLIGVNIHPY